MTHLILQPLPMPPTRLARPRRQLSSRMTLLCIGLAVASPALAQTNSTQANPAEPSEEAKAAATACDSGATSPLDPQGKAPPRYISDINPTFDRKITEDLIVACRTAALAFPDEQRFAIQLARAMFLEIGMENTILPTVRRFADNGHIEAQFMLWRMNRSKLDALRNPAETNRMLNLLRNAAEAGHAEALLEIYDLRRTGGLLKRDEAEALRWADHMIHLRPQGPAGEWAGWAEFEEIGRIYGATIQLRSATASAEDKAKAFAFLKAKYDGGDRMVLVPYAAALRNGSGTSKQPEAARALLEKAAATDPFARLQLARMLVQGEGGPRELARGLTLLDDKALQNLPERPRILADLFLNNQIVGRDPRRVIAAFQGARGDIDDSILLAGLLSDYQAKIDRNALVQRLALAAAVGEPGAGLALAKLKLSRNPDFRDEAGAREILALLARDGDPAIQILLARAHFTNLDSTSSSVVAKSPLDEAQLRKTIADGVAAGRADALLLQGQLTRKGVFYPQDDEAATKLIVKAADLGLVDAMLAAGKAYDDGLGVPKNPRERLRYWRKAAEMGSVEAKENLVSSFTFDFGARLMNLGEGISYAVALYGDGAGRRYGDQTNLGGLSIVNVQMSSLFSGGRISDFPRKAIAAAVIDGLQMAPAGTADDKLVVLGKAMPQDVRSEIEKVLKAEGKFSGDPNGYFGPEARIALRDLVTARGPWRQAATNTAVAPTAQAQPTAATGQPQIARAVVDSLREKAMQRMQSAKTDADRLAVIRMINALARLGDLQARWLLMSSYHQSGLVRKTVSAEELTRYSLDILVVKPDQAPKASFEFIFDLTSMYKQDRGRTFGAAFLAAVRDDPRLQDLSMLTEISKHMMFAPGVCDAVLTAAKQQKVAGLDDEGCSERSLDAIVAYAKKAGPANIESKARAQAVAEVTKLAQ